ncbi:MAG: hypothetical protein WC609_00415 [Candidatus Paceibacterota bacterium]|jgi:hypothetical protein
MTPKIKNIIIFTVIAVVFILIYIFFIKPSPAQPNLVSTTNNPTLPNIDGTTPGANTPASVFVTEDFLALLLGVQQIKIDDTIFSEPAFIGLHDSSITLTLDNTEGRPNPFAPLGRDVMTVVPPSCIPPQVLNSTTNTCVSPATN